MSFDDDVRDREPGTRAAVTILDTMREPALFGPWFGKTWRVAEVLLATLFGLPMTDEDAEIYRRFTRRTQLPTAPAREGWVIAGVRGGKSLIAALVIVFLACFRDYRPYLAPGERAVVMTLATDRRQSRVIFGYVRAFLEIPLLRQLVVNETRETIELSNHVVIEIHTSSFRSVRGYTCAAVICDELAYWPSDEGGKNPDVEIIKALRPRMTTIPGALLLCISSPYARRGAVWEAYRKHYGQDGDPVVVWQAPTLAMNPTVDAELIADAYAQDESAAAAEYGAEFRRDIESFVSRETVEAVVIPDRHELPPVAGTRYVAFADPSGGAVDSFTLAIAHVERLGQDAATGEDFGTTTIPKRAIINLATRERRDLHSVDASEYVATGDWRYAPDDERAASERVVRPATPRGAVLDCVREVRPPFSPADVVKEFAALLRTYRCYQVTADRYAGEWPRERFREQGITYTVCEKVRSDLYRDLLPLLTSGQVELLDHPRLIAQLCNLERRTARSGKDSIDHPPRGHDDVINAAAGALVLARGAAQHGYRIQPLVA